VPRIIRKKLDPEPPDNEEVLTEIASLREDIAELTKSLEKLTQHVADLEERVEEIESDH
jgi:phage shock protein A